MSETDDRERVGLAEDGTYRVGYGGILPTEAGWRTVWPEAVVLASADASCGARRYAPERTCTLAYEGRSGGRAVRRCSACGLLVGGTSDYCPHCGARVVEP
jgi:hypothetical protein